MSDTSKIAKNLARFRQSIYRHDEINRTHNAWGIGLNPFDMERLGFDEGETIWPGITIHADSKGTGNFRVLCDGQHDDDKAAEAEEAEAVTRAVGMEVNA